MDTELVKEIRKSVQPAVEQLIAFATERGLAAIEVRQDGLEIKVKRAPTKAFATVVPEEEDSTVSASAVEEDTHRLLPILSTLVGTFKIRPAADKAAAAAVGAYVSTGQVLGYVESMRLMNEVHAPVGGRLAELLVEDGHPVEYGQPLMVLETAE